MLSISCIENSFSIQLPVDDIIDVPIATFDHFEISGINNLIAKGRLNNIIVTAKDTNNNTFKNYTGTINFSSSDSDNTIILPNDYIFTLADEGTHVFTDGISLVTLGDQYITILDGSGSNVKKDITVVTRTAKILSSDGDIEDYYGGAVAISSDGSTVVVGSRNNDDGGENSGSAYIYHWSNGVWGETKLVASDAIADDFFGSSVSVSSTGMTVIIGSGYNDATGSRSGAVYIYKWDGSNWLETKLVGSNTIGYDYLGLSVSISEDGLSFIAGAPGANGIGDYNGAAYIYKWDGTNWLESIIIASDRDTDDEFGSSVSMSGDGNSVLIGTPGEETRTGSVYIYRLSGASWVETKLTASDGDVANNFGGSTSISYTGDQIVVGAAGNNNMGAIYFYEWNSPVWIEKKITASNITPHDDFGNALAMSLDGTSILVGSRRSDYGFGDTGSAYLYQRDGGNWIESEIFADDRGSVDHFGTSVSMSDSGKTIVIGSYDDDNGDNSGSAYIFE